MSTCLPQMRTDDLNWYVANLCGYQLKKLQKHFFFTSFSQALAQCYYMW